MTSTDTPETQQIDSVRLPKKTDHVLIGPDSGVDPTVSVVMPTMSEEEGVAECIDLVKSAVRKSSYQTEVVISNDSTDQTPILPVQKAL